MREQCKNTKFLPKSGQKINCCDQLLKQCLELIDREASVVLGSEDLEDLDISALNMIVCRDTLRLNKGVSHLTTLVSWVLGPGSWVMGHGSWGPWSWILGLVSWVLGPESWVPDREFLVTLR